MASVNMAVVVGYVGDNPKESMTQTGRKVAGITVATTEKGYTTQSGVTYPDKTEWHQIVLWGRLAEVVEKYVHKGSMVYVQGKLRTRSYEKDGITRYTTEIEADILQMLDRNTNGSNATPAQQVPSTNQNENKDDLPF
nr:MAG TPA: Single strand binding protein [Caudoviricetes sp.]